jgi:hypothetical protein
MADSPAPQGGPSKAPEESANSRLLVGYVVAIGAVGGSLLIRYALSGWLGLKVPYLLFYPAVIAASWFGGDLGMATTCVAAFGLIALVGLAFAPETKGAPLPSDPAVTVPPYAGPVEAAAISQERTS